MTEPAAPPPTISPFDTAFGATTRFLVELAAWVLGPWATARTLGWPVAVVVLVGLVLLPATFNARGDKQKTGVLVPGPVRLGIEVFLGLVAVGAGAVLWGAAGAAALGGLVVVAAVAGRRRSAWLLGRMEAANDA